MFNGNQGNPFSATKERGGVVGILFYNREYLLNISKANIIENIAKFGLMFYTLLGIFVGNIYWEYWEYIGLIEDVRWEYFVLHKRGVEIARILQNELHSEKLLLKQNYFALKMSKLIEVTWHLLY